MNGIQFYAIMSIPVAEQRSNTREPIQLANPGFLLRRVVSTVRKAIEMLERSLVLTTEEETYCMYNPAECRGIA